MRVYFGAGAAIAQQISARLQTSSGRLCEFGLTAVHQHSFGYAYFVLVFAVSSLVSAHMRCAHYTCVPSSAYGLACGVAGVVCAAKVRACVWDKQRDAPKHRARMQHMLPSVRQMRCATSVRILC
jgi:hypothetical protein